MADRVVAFYSGGPDDRGRTLAAILAWTDAALEDVHDYIQWMFPTVAPSGVNPSAPLVTAETIAEFAARPELRGTLRRSLARMLSFYGLRASDGAAARIEIDPPRFAERSAEWLTAGNHNHLRLTRIMQSLASLGLVAEARALQRCLLSDVCEGAGRGRVSDATRRYWMNAVA